MGGNTLHRFGEHREGAKADVIFIHGLDGNARTTWMANPKDKATFWPDWLAAERADINVWSLGYPASSSGWRGHGMDIITAANSLMDYLPQHGIGNRPTIYIAHSLGGLVVKQLLRSANESQIARNKALADQMRGIAFLATPHAGSEWANFGVLIGGFLPIRRKRTIESLRANDSALADLNSWYRNHSGKLGVASCVYREDMKTNGILVVNASSSDPGLADVPVTAIAACHITICKPKDQQDQVYVGVRDFLDEQQNQSLPQTPPPPPAAAPSEQTTAPAPALPPPARFFGREAEKAAMIAAALDDDPRPIIVLGQAGIGKSALTLQMLHDDGVAARFGARRYFIRLDTASDARGILTAIIQSWGEIPGPNPAAQVAAALGSAPALLTLDNGETPWQADPAGSEAVFAGLAAIETLTLVVSIRGQQSPPGPIWRKPAAELQPLPTDAAKALFLSIAGESLGDDPDLAKLLHALDGLPLAITLLAHLAEGETRLNALLADYRARRVTLNTGAGKDKNLATSIELSLNSGRLDEKARRMFAVLGRLPAGIADGDAAQLIDGGTIAARALRQIGLAFGAGDRTLMLAPMREYAAGCAIATDDYARAAAHYLTVLATEGKKVGREGGQKAVARLTPEFGNFEAIVADIAQSARGDGATHQPLIQSVVNAADGLSLLMRFSGLGSLANYQAVIAAARTLGDTLGEANCILRLGEIALDRSDYEAARTAFEKARPLYQSLGAIIGEANCIFRLGRIALTRSDHEAAQKAFEDARPLYHSVGDTLGEANCIQSLGDIALMRLDHEVAQKAFEDARPLYQSVGAIIGEAGCIYSLGEIALMRSDHEAARAAFEEARPLYQRIGAILGEANCILSLGDVALAEHDQGEAQALWQQALTLYRRCADPYSIGMTLRRLARISSGDDRARLIADARAAWAAIDRPDLIAELDAEFGAG